MLLVTGASGRIARRAAALLIARGLEIRLMPRTPAQVPMLRGAQVVFGDFTDTTSHDAAFAGISSALIVSGSGRPGERAELHRNTFRVAARAGAAHVVYLSLQGSSPHANYPNSRDPFTSEQYLAKTGSRTPFCASLFTWTPFWSVSMLMGNARPGRRDGGRLHLARGCGTFCRRRSGPASRRNSRRHRPEAIPRADVARRFSALADRPLRYIPESPAAARHRLAAQGLAPWQVDLGAGWFEAIAVGELLPITDTVSRLMGTESLTMESYFDAFPELLNPLRGAN